MDVMFCRYNVIAGRQEVRRLGSDVLYVWKYMELSEKHLSLHTVLWGWWRWVCVWWFLFVVVVVVSYT